MLSSFERCHHKEEDGKKYIISCKKERLKYLKFCAQKLCSLLKLPPTTQHPFEILKLNLRNVSHDDEKGVDAAIYSTSILDKCLLSICTKRMKYKMAKNAAETF